MMAKKVHWENVVNAESFEIFKQAGAALVSPTKVGYVIVTNDRKGLERKFKAKERNLNKPGVVLCASLEQLDQLADMNDEIRAFYKTHWDQDILLGCILPWKEEGKKHIPADGSVELMMDKRGTSCFVIRYGIPSEMLVKKLWDEEGKLTFASSANPSGKGNKGVATGIGEKIENEVDMIIEADDYVASIQPSQSVETRYEQGVMVSMVDADGKLIPEQKGQRMITPCPVLIRKGLDVNKIMVNLAEQFSSWDYRQGSYY